MSRRFAAATGHSVSVAMFRNRARCIPRANRNGPEPHSHSRIGTEAIGPTGIRPSRAESSPSPRGHDHTYRPPNHPLGLRQASLSPPTTAVGGRWLALPRRLALRVEWYWERRYVLGRLMKRITCGWRRTAVPSRPCPYLLIWTTGEIWCNSARRKKCSLRLNRAVGVRPRRVPVPGGPNGIVPRTALSRRAGLCQQHSSRS